MLTASAQIPAPAKDLLMEWALVLASQGIEADMVRDENGYSLIVSTEDCSAANEAILAYTRENAGRSAPLPPQPATPLKLHPAAFVWAGLVAFLFLRQTAYPELREFGLMNSNALMRGEWWRPITAMGLHADAAHLLSNLTFGVLFLGLAMNAFGLWPALVLSSIAGTLGYLAGWIVYPPTYQSLGASGLVMGALGLLAAQAVLGEPSTRNHAAGPFRHSVGRCRRAAVTNSGQPRGGGALRGLGAAILMLVLIGFSPQSDVVAHVGGFFFGVLGGILWLLLHPPTPIKTVEPSQVQTTPIPDYDDVG